ncbi:MAG: endonuclease I [Candidatus Krumholzibacteriia bacterium]|jgi:endonuclease I
MTATRLASSIFLLSLFAVMLPSSLLADAPLGYYDSVNEFSDATLRQTLHAVIDDHTRIPYTSSSLDTWNVLELADEDPNDSGRILDVYQNQSYQKFSAGNNDYNREHTWPKSYGFPDDGSTNYAYTDCHQLFLCDSGYNSSRGNKPYGTAGPGGTERGTVPNNGVGGGTGTYPGWSNWFSAAYWETWLDRRGDVARAMFYMDVRYEGGVHNTTLVNEPDLILTNNASLIQTTGTNASVAYMGILSVLLQWHIEDPVDAKELARNDAVFSFQGNRNPFIDHPEWVDCLFIGSCSGGELTPPEAPTGLSAAPGDGVVFLDWDDNVEADLDGYFVYRSTTMGGPYSVVNGNLTSLSQYTDIGLTNDVTYYYVVTASDFLANESLESAEANAMPILGGGSGGSLVWINEFHYDNVVTDTGEFFEIAGLANTDLSGWKIVGYNGNGGAVYNTINLSGVLPDQENGYGTLAFNMVGMQNGSPDGLALVDNQNTVVEFISYEGELTATSGVAVGEISVDVGVTESNSTPIGYSLQRIGSGSTSADFTWQAEAAHSSNLINPGQSFGSPNQVPSAAANGTYVGQAGSAVAFSSAGSIDPDGTIVAWAWDFGDGATSTLENPSHTYATSGTYIVTLTVTDNALAEDMDATSADIATPSAVDLPTVLPAALIAAVYPNPFNPATTIRFATGVAGHVQIDIYSIKGELVRTLLSEARPVGEFSLRWNGTNDAGQNVPSGAYLCRMRNGQEMDTQSLLLLK